MNLSRHRFQGKFALVTGGSRGIGRAVAERFAAEGGTVAINHYNDHAEAAETLKSLGRISEAEGHGSKLHRDAAADVAKLSDVKAMIDGLVQGWGRLDILVNNAGIQAETPGDGFDAATFERIIAVNIMGQAYCAEHAIAHFLTRAGGGVVINTTSVHEIIPKPGFLAYSVSKGGMGNLTRRYLDQIKHDEFASVIFHQEFADNAEIGLIVVTPGFNLKHQSVNFVLGQRPAPIVIPSPESAIGQCRRQPNH